MTYQDCGVAVHGQGSESAAVVAVVAVVAVAAVVAAVAGYCGCQAPV